jgi:RNA polymerase sigma factor (sigma-70 family)
MTELNEALAKEYDKIYEIALKITKGANIDAQDLTQECYIIMLEYDVEKMQKIYDNGHLKFWIARVMLNQYLRASSPFKKKHHTYLKDENAVVGNLSQDNSDEVIAEKIEFENKLSRIYASMSDLHFYDKTLFRVYYESDHSIRSLSESTGISTTSIFNTIKNVRTYIQNEVKDEQ